MNTNRYLLSLMLLGIYFLYSCTDYDVKTDNSFYNNVTIKINETKNDTLFVNLFNEQQISISTMPEDVVFDMRAFIYHVDDVNILKVDESGNILPVSLGTTEVSMIFRANQKVTTFCKICIWKDSIYIEQIIAPDINMKLGKTYDLNSTMTVVPENADSKELVFESLTPTIVSVDHAGMVVALAEGIGEIRISSIDGSGVSIICTVNVIAEVKVTEIQIPAGFDGETIGVGQTIDLGSQIVVLPANADNPELDYAVISGADVVSVDAYGVIKTIGSGTAVIRISSTDNSGIYKEITLNVNSDSLLYRAFWTVTTQTATDYGYVPDGNTGLPNHLFDNDTSTFLSLVKPGKSYSPIPSQSKDFIPSFTVDMQVQQTFNYVMWRHRGNNSYNYLRVYGIDVEGSDDGTTFNQINLDGIVWIPNTGGYVGAKSLADLNTYEIDIPESTYRYVKVKLVMWSDIYSNGATSGSTMQTSEFGLGRK